MKVKALPPFLGKRGRVFRVCWKPALSAVLGRGGVCIALRVCGCCCPQAVSARLILCLVGESTVVTESLFQIDEHNADKDASATVDGEYVKSYGKPSVVRVCGYPGIPVSLGGRFLYGEQYIELSTS